MATKKELRQEIRNLRHIGWQFANVAYNLAQSETAVPDPRHRKTLKDLQVLWDKIEVSER